MLLNDLSAQLLLAVWPRFVAEPWRSEMILQLLERMPFFKLAVGSVFPLIEASGTGFKGRYLLIIN